MESENRVAVITIILSSKESAAEVNKLLHDCEQYVVGRMGIPYRERGLSVINVVVDAPEDAISALSGKLGRLSGVTSKAVYAKQSR